MNRIWIARALIFTAFSCAASAQDRPAPAQPSASSVSTAELRMVTDLLQNWRFIQDNDLTEDAALAATGADWQTVSLPHTWNADAASTSATQAYERGRGWYRLEFDTPAAGARKWLEFGAASLVADVWLNGRKLGQHKGGFTLFRFDVTDVLAPSGKNVLLVKVDNSKPLSETGITTIPPLAGDFIMYGGLHRGVSLVATAEPVHFDLGDMGGPGVYASAHSISAGSATVNVRAKVKSHSREDTDRTVRASLLTADGKAAQTAQQTVRLNAGAVLTVSQDLVLSQPRLWQGVEDPHQYKLVAELLGADGKVLDRVVQDFGIREIRFDPDQGVFLNGKHVRLHGVAVHGEALGKGWAQSKEDIDQSLALVKEIGANTIRLGHYPFDRYTLESVNRMGLIAWAELPVGIGVTTEVDIAAPGTGQSVCPRRDASPAFQDNAKQQLQEMIRQQFNHASVAVWSVGNETTFMHKDCAEPWHDNLTPLFRELHALAKQEDPGRATTYADFTAGVAPPVNGSYIELGGITDVWARNEYPLWYGGAPTGDVLDALRTRYPAQPIGVSEYGAGAAITHHTDNVHGGPPEIQNTGQPVVYQPEEYGAYAHEQTYATYVSRKYLWATYAWNMFDFATDLRNEGDVRGVNTKGLVTFDRKTRKDPFWFYKANWSSDPVVYIAGRRYTNRAYHVADVKVYSNADTVELSVNGTVAGRLRQDACVLKTCVFPQVKLDQGANTLVAVGHRGGSPVTDTVEWRLNTNGINIAAGQIATGFRSASGELFGSDNFFIGGAGTWLEPKDFSTQFDRTPVRGTDSSDLFKNYRVGSFAYHVPLADGEYTVTLGFIEPHATMQIGQRVFNVVANGETKIQNLDVLQAAGAYRTAVVRSFNATVSDGTLKLNFTPAIGEAVVSNIMIRNAEPATGAVQTPARQ